MNNLQFFILLDIPTDSMRIESDDEDSDNPDELNPRSNRQTENVFSESEGEEMAPVTNVQQRNKNRNRYSYNLLNYLCFYIINMLIIILNSILGH